MVQRCTSKIAGNKFSLLLLRTEAFLAHKSQFTLELHETPAAMENKNMLALKYYVDESGNTGDVLNTGDNFDFGGQSVFALACIGFDDHTRLEDIISSLRKKYKIQAAELKCKALYKSSPKLFADLIDHLCSEKIPIFIEAVDKRYFVSINIVNCHVMPAYSSPPETVQSQIVRNHCADFIYNFAPTSVFEMFVRACKDPSNETLMESFEELRQFAAAYYPANALSSFLLDNIEESITDYLDLSAVEGANAWLRFIPVPDASKKGKSIWMLPNLTSFTNIYARINLYRGGDLSKVEIFHDEQAHFDEILKLNKSLLEKTDMRDAIVIDTANYTFTQSASLMFSKSHEHGGLQIVDLLAGMVMRYVQETMEGKKRSPDIIAAYDSILRMSNQYQGLGINLVVTNELHRELHF